MKKYLLFIISMLCVSIGTWAQETSGTFGASGTSTWELTGDSPNKTLTLTFNDANDLPFKAVVYEWGTSWEAICSATGITKVVVNTGSGVTLSGGADSPLASLSDNYKSIPLLDLSKASINIVETSSGSGIYCIPMAGGDNSTFNNIIVPSSYSNGLNVLQVTNRWNLGAYATLNTYQVSGNTISAVFKTDKSNYATLTDIKSDYVTLKLAADVTDAIDLSTVLPAGKTLDLTAVTTVATSSNDITVLPAADPKINVICLIDGVKSRVKPVESCNYPDVSTVITGTISDITTRVNSLASYGLCLEEANVTGVLSTADLTYLGTINGLKRLNLQEATLATGVELNSLAIPSTLEALVLPAAATMDETLKTKVTSSNLDYVYIPTNQTQDEEHQTIADYIWVNKPGGLSNALDNEAKLRSSWYMVVESDVALNNNDVNFWGPDPGQARLMQYRYLDFSGANVTPAMLYNYRVTDQLAYRIILPNDWTGDDMAVFAANPNCGNIAAVYSYTGTDHKRLDILELHDKAYMTTALNNPRIVRPGTTSIRVVSGHYGSNPVYGKLGKNLLAAINGAASTITSVTIAVGSGIYTLQNEGQENVEDVLVSTPTTFAFTNANLTNLTMNYINNSHLTVDVSGRSALTSLYLNETTLAGVNASGCSNLTTASLGHAIVGGDVNLSGTALTSLLEVDLAQITGTLNVSNSTATSFDFTQLTAIKIDASETNSLTSLDINGVSLNNNTWVAGDSNEDGKVKVTRTGGNYSGLTITKADGFDAERIIPQASSITPAENAYKLRTIAPSHVEITAAGSSLSGNIGNIWLDNDNNGTADAHPTPSEIEILHVTGTVTTDDLSYIAGMTGLKTLDLSEATGVTYSDIISAGLSTKTAIILPGTTNTEANMVTAMNAFQTSGYECVGYYTAKSETSKKLNVYGYNGTVANLKTGNITSQINATTGTMVEQPKLIDTNTDLTFLPVYGNTTASVPYLSTDNISYPQATPALLTAFREKFNSIDYPYSVDMSWLDISNLGVDFSGVKCHYLVIPQNTWAAETTRSNGITYNNDFTVTTGSEPVPYIYNSEVRAVSTYKGTAMPYATSAYFGGRGMLFDVYNLNETANLTYLISEGSLDDVRTHMSSLLQNADVIMIKGTLNSSDCTGLNSLSNKRIDLTRVALDNDGDDDDDFNWANFDNDNVWYLALPDGMNNAIAATSADDFAFSGCEALKAVGAYDPTNNKYTVHSTANTVTWTDAPANTTFSGQEASVFEVTKMCAPNASRQAGSALGTTNIVMSGYLTLSDIQMDGADAKAGLNTNSAGSVVTADFSNAVFMDNSHMCFTAATWNGNALTSILLPTDERQNTIPARCLYNYSALTEICIPYNYEHIGNAAFYLANLGHITTTDANGALVDNGAHTFTFSKNLKEIGEAPSPLTTGEGNAAYPTPLAEPVFFSYGYHDLTDIYVLRSGYEDGEPFNPTKCYRNAFGAGPTYGWGGFDGGNVYCREKYMNGSQLYTVLHFPDLASVSNDETKYNNVKEAYTDPTRVYTKKDQTGAVDANGESPQWPTHSELGRAYNEAIRGLIWEDWNIDTEKQANGNINGGTITTPPGNPADVSLVASPTRFNLNYTGWHEFVLSLATYVAPDEKVDEDNKIYRQYEKDENWYTFCIPFDMTEAEVIQLLGVPVSTDQIVTTLDDLHYDGDGKVENGESIGKVTTALLPEVRTIKSVTRNASTNTVNISTSLDLASGANKNKYYNPSSTPEYEPNGYLKTVNSSGVATDSDVPRMLRAGYPYLIKPYKLKGTTIGNLGKKVVTRYAFAMAASAIYQDCWDQFSTSKFARPYEGHKIQAQEDSETGGGMNHTDEKHSGKPYNYTFVGQFWEQSMPLHSFYQNSKQVWKHYQNYNNKYIWYPYICIITVTDEVRSDAETGANKELQGGGFRNEMDTQYPNRTGLDAKGHDVFDHDLRIVYKDGLDDPFNTASARGYTFVFDEDIMDMGDGSETTAIDRLDGVDIIPANGKVYNMNGQLVGKSLDGLSKGMYIVNGKKYVIK